tara:strand:- start:372 stop:821 length:450 start_codon:yes stop_codon:yes gene_type:complete
LSYWLKRKKQIPSEAPIPQPEELPDLITEEDMLNVRTEWGQNIGYDLVPSILKTVLDTHKIDPFDFLIWGFENIKPEEEFRKALTSGEYRDIKLTDDETLSLTNGYGLLVIAAAQIGVLGRFTETLKQNRAHLVGVVESSYNTYYASRT